MDLLAAVHADQEGLIADLSEDLSASRSQCAELEAKIGNLCGPPHSIGPLDLGRHPTRLAELESAATHVTELEQQLSQARVNTPAGSRARAMQNPKNCFMHKMPRMHPSLSGHAAAFTAALEMLKVDC